MRTDNLLLEIGTEELPPKSLKQLMLSLEQNLGDELKSAGFSFKGTKSYATPRRLAVVVENLVEVQQDQQVERKGPSVSAAYDESGKPTKALLGFARSCGVEDLTTLEKLDTEKGQWLVYRGIKKGKHLHEEVERIINSALTNLPIDRKMRWGSTRLEFVRPVHWVILLYGDKIVPANILGQSTGRTTRGHRFMSAGEVEVTRAEDYLPVLEQASVIADFDHRQSLILQQLNEQANALQGNLELDARLLDEVTSLVEWPCALSGSFDKSFLEIPVEALVSAMREHQRYFHLTNNNGELLPNFITVANIKSKNPDAIIAGNERVIRPRLSDAAFFFKKDAATSMEDKLSILKKVIFQSELGTYHQKAQRISSLAGFIAAMLQVDEDASRRAGLLCKADLVSEMVNEFPDLQGIMGGYYARADGELPVVCNAIREHYLPTHSGGDLPSDMVASCVALADKLDTLVGLFAIGQPPSGSRDPFALRRQTIGVIRICIENELSLDLTKCLQASLEIHHRSESSSAVRQYILERLANWYADKGIDHDVFDAVRHSRIGIANLLESDQRIHSMQKFRQHQQAPNLVAANKRVSNILKKTGIDAFAEPDSALFVETCEHKLAAEIKTIKHDFSLDQLDYEEKFLRLAQLQPLVDQYFDDVMVMSDDEKLRNNRLSTLAELRSIFLEVADFSRLQS